MEKKSSLVDVNRGHDRRLEGDVLDQVGCLDERLEPGVGRRLGGNVLLGLRNARRKLGKLRLRDVVG